MENHLIKRKNKIIKLLGAILFCGLGVTLFIKINMGSDTLTVFQEGLSKLFHISLGNAATLYNIITLIIAFFISRKLIGWTTFIYAIAVGNSINFFSLLFTNVNIISFSFEIKLLIIAVAQLCIVTALALLILCQNGMNQLDAIIYYIESKTKLSYKMIRTIFDITFIFTGWMMGGEVGIGSIIAMGTTGYGVDKIVNIINNKDNSQSKDNLE